MGLHAEKAVVPYMVKCARALDMVIDRAYLVKGLAHGVRRAAVERGHASEV